MESKIKNLIAQAWNEAIGAKLVEANLVEARGTNIWVVWTEATVTVETFDSSEWPAGWKAEVTKAVHWGRAIGWESQDCEEWGYSWDDDREVFVTQTGAVFEHEADAARWAVNEGHCPELIDDAMDRLREALAQQEAA